MGREKMLLPSRADLRDASQALDHATRCYDAFADSVFDHCDDMVSDLARVYCNDPRGLAWVETMRFKIAQDQAKFQKAVVAQAVAARYLTTWEDWADRLHIGGVNTALLDWIDEKQDRLADMKATLLGIEKDAIVERSRAS